MTQGKEAISLYHQAESGYSTTQESGGHLDLKHPQAQRAGESLATRSIVGFVVPVCPVTQIFACFLKSTGYWQDQDFQHLGRISESRRSFLGSRSRAQKGREPRRATPQQRDAHALRHRGLRRMMNSGARVRAAVSLSPSAPADGLFRSPAPLTCRRVSGRSLVHAGPGLWTSLAQCPGAGAPDPRWPWRAAQLATG